MFRLFYNQLLSISNLQINDEFEQNIFVIKTKELISRPLKDNYFIR